MIKLIMDFMRSLFKGNKLPSQQAKDSVNLAICELLFHVALSDNKITDDERSLIYSTAQDRLGIPVTFLENHLKDMNDGKDKQIDLIHISNFLKNQMDHYERELLIKTLISLSYSDKQLDSSEDFRVWEIAQLLDVEVIRPLSQ